ncbi:MAG: hypothetical protein AAFV98_21845 [Chloroflexota bacterium]
MSKQFPSISEMIVTTVATLPIASWHIEGKGIGIGYNPLVLQGAFISSILERIIEVIDGGIPRYGIFSGTDSSLLVHKIGYKDDFYLHVYIIGNPPLDPIINYIADRDHLSEIERLFNS